LHRYNQAKYSKIRAFMKFPRKTLMLGLAFALGLGAAQAEKADRNKPIQIESDALRYDDAKQISVFTGRVVLTKGSIVIRGARLEVKQDPQGYQYGVVTEEAGKRAFFRQRRESVEEEYVEGQAELIEYNGRADMVTLTGGAQLRRLRGEVLADEVLGSVIRYNNLTDVFSVDGAADQSKSGRVRVMLIPKSNTPPATASQSEKRP
jgi:lipopolysaccharide export system protein LptA